MPTFHFSDDCCNTQSMTLNEDKLSRLNPRLYNTRTYASYTILRCLFDQLDSLSLSSPQCSVTCLQVSISSKLRLYQYFFNSTATRVCIDVQMLCSLKRIDGLYCIMYLRLVLIG